MSHCIITRKLGESVVIEIPPQKKAQKMQISITGRKGNDIKVGIDAPRDFIFIRSELKKNGIINKEPQQLDLLGE